MQDTFAKLAELFARFPGIGPRQSKRFVYFLLASPSGVRDELVRLILELKKIVGVCGQCRRFFTLGANRAALCSICGDPKRDHALLMLVEKDVDLETVEKARSWNGTYFVLGGTVPILEKKPAAHVRLQQLEKLIGERGASGTLKEIVLALSLTTEGEYTAEYLEKELAPLAAKHGFKLSTLGRGLSTGSELEYADPETIKNALKNRN